MKGYMQWSVITSSSRNRTFPFKYKIRLYQYVFHEKRSIYIFFKLKVHLYVLGEATRPFSFLPCFSVRGQFLTERRSNFLSLGVDSVLKGIRHPKKRTENQESSSPLKKKKTENMDL